MFFFFFSLPIQGEAWTKVPFLPKCPILDFHDTCLYLGLNINICLGIFCWKANPVILFLIGQTGVCLCFNLNLQCCVLGA